MGCRHRNPLSESAEQGIEGSHSDVAGQERLRLHDDVPDYADAFALGAGKFGGGKCREPNFGGRADAQVCASGARPYASFALASKRKLSPQLRDATEKTHG